MREARLTENYNHWWTWTWVYIYQQFWSAGWVELVNTPLFLSIWCSAWAHHWFCAAYTRNQNSGATIDPSAAPPQKPIAFPSSQCAIQTKTKSLNRKMWLTVPNSLSYARPNRLCRRICYFKHTNFTVCMCTEAIHGVYLSNFAIGSRALHRWHNSRSGKMPTSVVPVSPQQSPAHAREREKPNNRRDPKWAICGICFCFILSIPAWHFLILSIGSISRFRCSVLSDSFIHTFLFLSCYLLVVGAGQHWPAIYFMWQLPVHFFFYNTFSYCASLYNLLSQRHSNNKMWLRPANYSVYQYLHRVC